MWKPGAERPKKSKSKGQDQGSGLSSGLMASHKSPPAVKKLSSGTMNMRFMQRTSISPKQLQHQTQKQQSPIPEKANAASPMDVEPHLDADGNNDNETTTTKSRFVAATAQDMYGTVLMGRRSFGGFRPVVEQMHKQSLKSVDAADVKRKRKRGK